MKKIPLYLQFFAAGRVCTGFSRPYVAKYNANAGIVTFTEGRRLARGVSVDLEVNSSSDNKFYADNQAAESASGAFTNGTVKLTVDGLFYDAERFVQGLPAAGSDGWAHYGDDKNTPNIAVGYIVRYQSDGVITYVPTVLPKTKFGLFNQSAKTQEQEIDWQTQEINADIMRADDPNHNWKYIGNDYMTEAEAEIALQTKLGIYVVNPVVEPVADGVTMFGALVSDMQSDIKIIGNKITGTLKYIEGGLAESGPLSGSGNFLALQLENLDSRATSVKMGFLPSEGTGLVEVIDDPDKNGVGKVTNKNTQKFTVVSSDGTHTVTTQYDLSELVVEDAGA